MFNIYGILCKTTWKIYYGSTKDTVEQRLKKHEIDYKAYLNGYYKYVSSYEVLKNNNYEIRLLEECDDDKFHMRERENFYIDNFPCVNIQRAGVPGREHNDYKKEWYKNNKEKILEERKEYYEANKEKISEKSKEKYTCACGSIDITIGHKARHETTLKHKKYLASL